MSVVLATLCINELEWLDRLHRQHRNWPEMVKWVFVESADVVYAECNPDRVTKDGLSVDGTSAFLRDLALKDDRIVYIPHGWCGGSHMERDQGKCEARNRYLEVADEIKPDLVVIVDGDEFYTHLHQQAISSILKTCSHKNINPRARFNGSALCFKQRHIWYPPFLQEVIGRTRFPEYKLLSHEAVGGYWDVIHCRVWKWEQGIRYVRTHNWPETPRGELLVHRGAPMLRTDTRIPTCLRHKTVPECIHFGYASSAVSRLAKHRYYEERGEGREPNPRLRNMRRMYVDCRNEYRSWEPGNKLPHGAKIIPYKGPIPEVFLEQDMKDADVSNNGQGSDSLDKLLKT